MQGAIENFYKCVDELKRQYANVKIKITYDRYWILDVVIDNKTICNFRGNDTNTLFNNGANRLLDYIRNGE